jgi:hypothetical protein
VPYGGKPVPVAPASPMPMMPSQAAQIAPGTPMYGKPIPRANPVSANHPDPFAKMGFHELRELRASLPDPEAQKFLAPYEHRAYARELMGQDPKMGLGLLAGIPGYQIAKGLGMGSRTGSRDPWGQIKGGYTGLGEGLMGLFR